VPFSVLLVDDDSAFRGLACRMLVGLGLEVVANVGTVASAAAAADELRPDAALVDVGLPDGDGVTLARMLAALPWQPRIVLTSSDPDAVDHDTARSVGAIAFVPKAELADAPLRKMLAGE
jgi:CheY-like chemotaxis protein